jgi:glycosyltransferase domain-containing protein
VTKVGIIIPTMNRPDFLKRQLSYYASTRSPHPVYIGDASDSSQQHKNQLAINELQDKLKIHYFHWPGVNDRATITRLATHVEESFCAFSGDDDFLIPSPLTKCAEVLSCSLGYRTAQGKGVLFSTENDMALGTVNNISPYWTKKESLGESASLRLSQHSKKYWVPQFSVHRTDEFLEDSVHYEDIQNKTFGELLHSFTFATKGKSMFVDCLYLFRQSHSCRYFLPSMTDWITNENWYSSYKTFETVLTQILVDLDGLDETKATKLVKQSFSVYMDCVNVTSKKEFWDLSEIRMMLKHQPFIKDFVNFIKGHMSPSHHLTLPVMSTKRSPYYQDCLDVLNAVQNSSE